MELRLISGKKLDSGVLDIVNVERNISGHAIITTRYGKKHTTLDLYKVVKNEVKRSRNRKIAGI